MNHQRIIYKIMILIIINMLYTNIIKSQNCYFIENEIYFLKEGRANLRKDPNIESEVIKELDKYRFKLLIINSDSIKNNYVLVKAINDSLSYETMESHIIEEYIGWVSIPLIKIVGDTYQFSKPSTDPKLSEIEELIDEELFYSRYRKCVYNPSRLAYAYSQKGRLTYEQKKFKEAIVFFNQAIELSTVNSEAYKLISFYYRALCKFELKDMFGTISDLGNIIGKEKSYNGNLVFDWTHNSKNSFVIYGVTYPLIDKENAYLTLAAANARLKNYNKALELINIVLRNNTKSGSGYFLRAQINLTLSKRKEACKDASKAGELEINEAYEFIDKYCQ